MLRMRGIRLTVLLAVAVVVVGCNPGGGGSGETTSPTSVTRGYDY